jgi:hypothetical protein
MVSKRCEHLGRPNRNYKWVDLLSLSISARVTAMARTDLLDIVSAATWEMSSSCTSSGQSRQNNGPYLADFRF